MCVWCVCVFECTEKTLKPSTQGLEVRGERSSRKPRDKTSDRTSKEPHRRSQPTLTATSHRTNSYRLTPTHLHHDDIWKAPHLRELVCGEAEGLGFGLRKSHHIPVHGTA